MKFSFASALAAAVLSTAAALPARASEATDKAEIRRIYAEAEAEYKRGDLSKIGSHSTADCKLRLLNGRALDKKQFLQHIRAELKAMKLKALSIEVNPIQITGKNAVVMARSTSTWLWRDKKGRTHTIHAVSRGREHWIKSGGAWKEQLAEQLSEEVRMDGKLVRHR